MHTVAALVIPVIALRLVVGWKEIRRNLLFVELAIFASVLPMAAVATFSYEFPSVVGGVIGLLTTIFLAQTRHRSGERPTEHHGLVKPGSQSASSPQLSEVSPLPPGDVLRALTPLIATVGILLVTRIPFLGLRQLLTSEASWISIPLGKLGVFSLSPSLVFQLRGILGEDLHWSHALLFVPSILPFFVAAVLALVALSLPVERFSRGRQEKLSRVFAIR